MDTLYTEAHDHLHHAVSDAKREMDAAYIAYAQAPYAEVDDAYHAYLVASTRHQTFIEAGAIMSLFMEEE